MQVSGCEHITAVSTVKQPKQRVCEVHKARFRLGSSTHLPELRLDAVLRQLTQSPRDET